MPADVRDAYRLLSVPQNREVYQELLALCESDEVTYQPPDKYPQFADTCRKFGLTIYRDGIQEDGYRLRAPGQAPPRFETNRPPRPPPPPPITFGQAAAHVASQILKLKVFRGRGTIAKLFLALAYIAGLAGIAFAAYWTWDEYEIKSGRRAAAQRKALQESLQKDHAVLTEQLGRLARASATFESEFERVTHVPLRSAGSSATVRPRELDLLISRDYAAAKAWAEMLNAAVPAEELSAARKTLAQVAERLRSGVFDRSDRLQLDALLPWAATRLEKLQAQKKNLAQIERTLEPNQSEKPPDTSKRSSP